MNKKELKEYLQKNEGATLTADTLEPSAEKKGFMVSLYGSEIQENNINKVIDKIYQRAEELKNGKKKRFFVGVWLYEGTWYIDTSLNIKDFKKAVKFGESQKQIAIYDLEKNTSIKLKYKKIKYFTLYEIIKDCQENIIDEIPLKQYDNIKDIEKKLKMKTNCVYKAIKRNSTINCKYKLYLDYMLESELF